MEFHTPGEVFAHLDRLRRAREQAREHEKQFLTEIKKVLRIAGTLRFNGEPINRTQLIAHAGLSRRTAYQVLPPEPQPHQPANRVHDTQDETC